MLFLQHFCVVSFPFTHQGVAGRLGAQLLIDNGRHHDVYAARRQLRTTCSSAGISSLMEMTSPGNINSDDAVVELFEAECSSR